MKRKWLPTLGELIDRLSIHQLKEVFITENKKNYASEIVSQVLYSNKNTNNIFIVINISLSFYSSLSISFPIVYVIDT